MTLGPVTPPASLWLASVLFLRHQWVGNKNNTHYRTHCRVTVTMHGREEKKEGKSRKIPADSEYPFRYLGREFKIHIHYDCSVGMYMLGHGGLLPVHFYEAF